MEYKKRFSSLAGVVEQWKEHTDKLRSVLNHGNTLVPRLNKLAALCQRGNSQKRTEVLGVLATLPGIEQRLFERHCEQVDLVNNKLNLYLNMLKQEVSNMQQLMNEIIEKYRSEAEYNDVEYFCTSTIQNVRSKPNSDSKKSKKGNGGGKASTTQAWLPPVSDYLQWSEYIYRTHALEYHNLASLVQGFQAALRTPATPSDNPDPNSFSGRT
eukprot:CAMPEP_0175128542 /NCGR_PEP_ID=MMETSP0087-20121206/4984_1 /TAXON_ID=136419 /ORGANISM="Unknown Unknown, Strain D1" /LENGTH=211 /DNA_ID=CAMNT_0016410611 /DNA_START=141 /DNA_END=773 /DNA_ORIENTATION=+